MKILVRNRGQIPNVKIDEPWVWISVTDPQRYWAETTCPNMQASLKLKFGDVDDKKFLYCFSEYHAKKVINFYNEWKDKVSCFVINCQAGISRSAGIAAALSKIHTDNDKMFFEPYYCPNRLVYRTILEVYYNKNNNGG